MRYIWQAPNRSKVIRRRWEKGFWGLFLGLYGSSSKSWAFWDSWDAPSCSGDDDGSV